MRSTVDLPQPEGPSRERKEPCEVRKFIPLRAVRDLRLSLNSFVRPVRLMPSDKRRVFLGAWSSRAAPNTLGPGSVGVHPLQISARTSTMGMSVVPRSEAPMSFKRTPCHSARDGQHYRTYESRFGRTSRRSRL